MPLEQGVETVSKLAFEDMGFAHIDHQRELRQGFPEVVYAEGKTAEQVTAIMTRLAAESARSVVATRVSPEQAAIVRKALPEAIYEETARIVYIKRARPRSDAADPGADGGNERYSRG